MRREGRAAGARFAAGDTVAVIGLGANGIMLGLVAREAGAKTLVGCDPIPRGERTSLRLGFDQVLAPEEEFSEKVKRGSPRARTSSSCCRLPSPPSASALAAAGPAARVVFYSPVEPGKTWTLSPHSYLSRDLSLLFSYSSGARDFREALALIERGVVRASDLVTHRVPLRRRRGVPLARAGGDVLKVMVTI